MREGRGDLGERLDGVLRAACLQCVSRGIEFAGFAREGDGLDLLRRNILAAQIHGPGPGDVHRELVRQLLEVVVLGDKRRLTPEFEHHGDLSAGVNVGLDDTLRRLPVLPLGGHGLSLLPKEVGRLVEVAAGLLQSPLAVHHSRSGGLAECFHGCSINCQI